KGSRGIRRGQWYRLVFQFPIRELEWMRLDEKKSCRIQFSTKADGFNKETWPQAVAWHLEQMTKLEKALKGPLQKAAEAMKQKNFD
ncbi:DUF4268 domain-containing protein, partial [Escherichia coli]|uniref:DUF4268 domain-containing protein n=1 Tax=Escherichia coli TaxID=562 RepID=UPI00201A8388